MFIPLHDANALRHIRLQYVTLVIIVLNCAIWLVFAAAGANDPQATRAAFFSYGFVPAVANGYEALPPEWVVLPGPAAYVTYAFLHGSFMHLAGNMLFLWVFGDNVEDAIGHFRFVFFYLACAAAGAFAHSLAEPASVSPLIGASGAAAGIIAAYLLLHPHVKVWILAFGRFPLRIPAMWVIGAWILFQIANFIFGSSEQVSWAAHVGGIVAGAALLPILKRPGVALFDRLPAGGPPVPPPPPAAPAQTAAPPDDGRLRPIDAPRDSAVAPAPPTPWGRQRRD
ncbi:MAG: rhomboid family intramembrane serine protease [Alphaproteobacteria bacterium]|nr:MAG: rhomboid family intramembrane serine protease [Alphaproteobacteria bacterium]